MNVKKTLLISSIIATIAFSLQILAADKLYDKRFKGWEEKAKKGNAYSQYSLGNAYLRGNEVNIDVDKAIHWFTQAANQNHAKSEYKLGYLFYSGKGVKRNLKTAFKWFEKAAKQSYSPAQFYLGKMYAAGQGTDKDNSKALAWLKKARANDYSPAAREIAKLNSAPTQTQAQPAPKPRKPKKVAKKKSQKKTSKKSGNKMDTTILLLQGRWLADNKPAAILPSAINECSLADGNIVCQSQELNRSNEFAEINYVAKSTLSKLNSNGSFVISKQQNIIFVLPSDPDDPDADPENIPPTGLTPPDSMRCKFKNNNKISCATDDLQRVIFTRN